MEVEGCTFPKVPIDGGSKVNLMLEDCEVSKLTTSPEVITNL